jgi:hypothetical protein
MQPVSYTFKGQAKVSVTQGGRIVRHTKWQRNLLLDQGLDAIAENPICDIFRVAAKGTGTTPTSETPDGANTYTWTLGSQTITRTAGTRDFTIDDVGRLIRFTVSGKEALITGFNSATSVDVDRLSDATETNKAIKLYYVNQVGLDAEAGRTSTYSLIAAENGTVRGTSTLANTQTFTRSFVFDPEPDSVESVTGAYSRSGNTVTATGPGRDFVAGDVGKVVAFDDGTEYVITGVTSITVFTVDKTTGPTASTGVTLYGFTDYTEIGFSHLDEVGDNINIRILLDTPVRAYASTGINPSQQVKVTYKMTLAVTPNTVQPSLSTYVNFPIADTESVMSGNKQGQYVIENVMTSRVGEDGDTDMTDALLDPSEAGSCGLSTDTAALVALAGPVRSAGAVSMDFESDVYVPGTFQRTYRASFLINDAINNAWRSFMLYNPDNGLSAFTFLFRSNQKKDGEHTLSVVLTKSWGRDLSE